MPPRRRTTDQLLVREFQEVLGLEPVDAHRSAFTALAFFNRRWTKAKIGRYLGISRARVEQKVNKYVDHAKGDKMPVLARVVGEQTNGHLPKREKNLRDALVEYTPDDWQDLTFAGEMLKRVV
jgi:hypothetical protein